MSTSTPIPAAQPRQRCLLKPGAVVGRYQLLRQLGEGSFGEVWEAKSLQNDLPWALKLVPLGGPQADLEEDALKLWKRIKDTAHVVKLVDYGKAGGFLYLAMGLGMCTLQDRLEDALDNGLPGIARDELLGYLRDAAKGLDYLHGHRHTCEAGTLLALQHKDVKPTNLLVVSGNAVKVADLGAAQLLEGASAEFRGTCTPHYAPPEFFAGRVTSGSDQYSLALTYCKLRNNRFPFAKADLANREVMEASRQAERLDLSFLPQEERPVLARVLSANPKHRYPSCLAFVDALAGLDQDEVGQPVAEVGLHLALSNPHLVLEPSRQTVPLTVRIIRGDCAEPLRVRCQDLPEGVHATAPPVLGPNKERAILELTAWPEAAGTEKTVRVVAEAGNAILASREFHLEVTVNQTEQARAIAQIAELGGRWEVQREAPRGWGMSPVVAVNLSDRPATAEHLERILRGLPVLQDLTLIQRSVGDKELVHLRHCSRLRSLLLGKTRITDEGLREVGKLSRLAKLSLVSCPISDAALVHLQGLTELRTLDLTWCKAVGDEGLAHLCVLPRLEKLVLAETAATGQGGQKLQVLRQEQGLEPVEIVWHW